MCDCLSLKLENELCYKKKTHTDNTYFVLGPGLMWLPLAALTNEMSTDLYQLFQKYVFLFISKPGVTEPQ